MTTYDVFLSHASADKPSVETLARRLRDDGVEPFLDKWHLVPGEPWQEALEDALEASRTCAVFVGKKLGPWQNEEMRTALDERVRDPDFRVIPVLLPGGLKPGKKGLVDAAGATVGITTALRGAGGFGKTALAQALCEDPVVREATSKATGGPRRRPPRRPGRTP